MKFDVVTLFPEMVNGPLSESILGKAREKGLVELGFVNPRDFTKDKHKTVDDRPYGGGPGMVMMAEPLYQAVKKVKKKNSTVVLMSPLGKKLDNKLAQKLAKKKHLIIVCGHYEGIDQRFVDTVDMEVSIGDYVLTGGEPAATVLIDCISRFVPGLFKKSEVPYLESFSNGMLEASQYTRPEVWRRKRVPKILLSGNHKLIEKWREEESRKTTKKRRPDLMKKEIV
jgi:tRNA (guanine37-N1)-methyltransferase